MSAEVLEMRRQGYKDRFVRLYLAESYEYFNASDWLQYFKLKAKEHSITYIVEPYKDSKILDGLVNRFKPSEIKDMIDFLFDAEHDLVKAKCLINVRLLSASWINTVYNSSKLWKDGLYSSVSNPSNGGRNREYHKNTDSDKSSKPRKNRIYV